MVIGGIKMADAQTLEQKYDVRNGPLAQTYGLFAPGTHNTGAQISADRIADVGLRSAWFYVSNVPFAAKRKGELLLGIGLTPSAFDVVFGTDTKNVCQSLINTGYIHLNDAQRNQVLMLERRGEVVFVEPSALGLKGNDTEYRSFPIRTGQYDKDVTLARMPFVSAGYGLGYMLGQVMDNLKQNSRLSETRVFTMNPEHAAENVGDDEIVARASRLGNFDSSSSFDAGVREVDYLDALRGVLLKESAEGGAAEKSPLETLVGKGSVAHGDIAVVRQSDISLKDWQLLTQGR